MKASEAFSRYPNTAPYVAAAIPSFDTEGMTAQQIFQRAVYGSVSSTRSILNIFEREGLVLSKEGPPYGKRNIPAKLWRHAHHRPPHGISEDAAMFIQEVIA